MTMNEYLFRSEAEALTWIDRMRRLGYTCSSPWPATFGRWSVMSNK